MLQLLYGAIFGEIFMILSFLFKTPFRKLVIITLDRVKRGRGPAVVKTVAATLLLLLASSLHSVYKIRRRSFEAGGGGGVVNPTDQVLMSNHVLEASLLGKLKLVVSFRFIVNLMVPYTLQCAMLSIYLPNLN